MTVVTKALAKLIKPERNVRIHSQKQINEFKRSIEMFGQIRPIVIDENNVILAGNGLYTALTELGRTEASCIVVSGLSETGKKKLMLADNKIYSLGVDDLQAFQDIVLELDNDFDIPGYDPDLLQTLTIDLSGADDIMAGYGLVSDDTRSEMQAAEQRYEQEQESFTESAQQFYPASQTPGEDTEGAGHAGILPQEQTGADGQPAVLQQRFLICPKCGERIWL